VLSGLIFTAFLLGLGGVPHCLAMCGAACAAAFPRGVPLLSLVGRCLGYTLLGGVAAASSGLVAQWGRQVAFVQPLWVLMQAMALVMGLVLLFSGRMPELLETFGQNAYRSARSRWVDARLVQRWPWLRPMLPLLAGMAWAALPCGLLYAALMVAALASSGVGGMVVMLAFSLPGAAGVWAAPALLRWLTRRSSVAHATSSQAPEIPAGASAAPEFSPVIWMRQVPVSPLLAAAQPGDGQSSQDVPAQWLDPRWAVRLAGLTLAIMSAWALYHQVMDQWRAWCA
jgi:sulfite exporter TauE/SafE